MKFFSLNLLLLIFFVVKFLILEQKIYPGLKIILSIILYMNFKGILIICISLCVILIILDIILTDVFIIILLKVNIYKIIPKPKPKKIKSLKFPVWEFIHKKNNAYST